MKPWIKNLLFYIAGVLTPIVLSMMIFGGGGNSGGFPGLTIFPEKGECISKKSFKIFQVLESNITLASELSHTEYVLYNGKAVMIVNDSGINYYDDQVIKMPSGKCAKHIGTYEYRAKNGMDKTVPVVSVE